MQLIGVIALVAALLAPALAACTEPPPPSPKVGEEYEITRSYETSEEATDGSSSNSSGQDTVVERVTGVRDDGLELEYDLPKDATVEDRARSWQFPAHVFRPTSGPMQLLNSHELDARLESWLKTAGWTRDMCGRWIFTWNAFRIECDPQSVIKTIEAVDLRSAEIRAGAPYQEIEGRGPGTLVRKAAGPNGVTFAVDMEVDPDAVRRSRAETDVVVGGFVQKPVTLEAALRERAKDDVSGTISVTFDMDSAGNVYRRTKVTKLETKRPDGQSESRTATEVVERRLVSGGS